jgi:putative ATPase
MKKNEPLAFRMSPQNIDEFRGQEDIIGKDKLLYRMIKADKISSIILYGPPGTGKTSIARIIARSTKSNFEKLNAVTSGVKDIRNIIEDTKNSILNPFGKTVLFIDEIHRFNKSQQDALLPSVEDGTIVLIGATTENPYFEVNKALISRSQVFMLRPLSNKDIDDILQNALTDNIRGLGALNISLNEDAKKHLINMSNGDARVALNTLELAVDTTTADKEGNIIIDIDTIVDCIQKKPIYFDKSGEGHYDNISAFIKSMRGSDPDAAVFYLARSLYAGEDPVFIARRIIICASEDVGMANPQALVVANAAAQAVHMTGMPEARIILSEAAIMVATSPKSNSSYAAINAAMNDVASKNTGEIPMQLRNAPIRAMKEQGYGKGYKYAHSFEGNIAPDMEYLPEEVKNTVYYKPTNNGYESKIKMWLDKRRKDNK